MISCSTMLALILGKILRSGHSIWICVDGVHHFLKAIARITSTGRVITNDCCTESISKGHCYSCITLNKFGGTMQILKILLVVNCARAVYRERKKYIDEIDWNMLAVPPTGSHKAHNTELEDEPPTKSRLSSAFVKRSFNQLYWFKTSRT
ncbi:uncharacterized protein LOC133788546 [Humulus lupulus]|uniref:uncharacterized protein LOC133788546 n=1 Tax=Humulus lupulus TaxID=3486 RepID=UPI002B4108F9|nr:uncharacterized protein LOC133788546 [Humulus lupulus]XP_062082053.1 uncharacterized protein LOC133788546 [Humulus lupulus]XP_062082054.1 uncharacterized protein LOC133788546 [Humulus lupulus]XP_062082055.1 uncharacterized protein LOC133788546 [Humulus lupulus]